MVVLRTFSLLVIISFSLQLHAVEFKHFKLKNNKGIEKSALTVGVPTIPTPTRSIYNEIEDLLNNRYQSTGTSLTGSILNYRNNFNLGSENYSGLTWQKAMGGYNIGIDRQLSPDLFDDKRWIVTDKFFIEVSAESLLSKMKEDGTIEITEGSLAAFAGLEFRRVYTYVHYANDYEEGLTSDYSLLFLPFKRLNLSELEQMEMYHILTKEDYWALDLAAAAKLPTYQGITFEGGFLARFKKLSKLTIQAVGPEDTKDSNEKLRISFEKSSGKEIAIDSTLSLDFFNIMKLTLFHYELSYDFNESYTSFLSLKNGDLAHILNKPLQKTEMENIINLKKPDLVALAPYVVSKEIRINETMRSKYSLLLLGSLNKYQGEQLTIEKDGKLTTFMRSYQTSVKYVQGFWATLLNSFARAIINSDIVTQYKSSRTKKATLEYDRAAIYQGKNKEPYLTDSEKLSIVIEHEYQAMSTTGRFDKKYREYASHFVNNFTSLSPNISHAVSSKSLRGPLKIKLRALINKAGIDYFNQLSSKWIIGQFSRVCEYDGNSVWDDSLSSDSNSICYARLTNKYRSYIDEARRNGDLSLWKLKDFLSSFNNYSDHRYDLVLLFGKENVFYSGNIKAITNDGKDFSSPFKEGTYRSEGIVDEFQTGIGMRAPASLSR